MTQRLYYADSKQLSFSAVVMDVRERTRDNGQSLWDIALDQSAFYPTSGGQPYDTGVLRAISRGGSKLDAAVIDVVEDDSGQVWHCTSKPLNTGTPVTGEIDWVRRFDHMQQHSGQHLLSAVFLREMNVATTSFHLGDQTASIDLAIADLSEDAVQQIELIANQIITENRNVSLRTVTQIEARELLNLGGLRKLPPRDGDVRLVEIDSLDLNACGGTHVQSTGEIGALLLRRVERTRGGTRVEFVCGGRAVKSARMDYQYVTGAAELLSVGTSQLPAAVQKLLAETKLAEHQRWALLEELAEFHADELLRSTKEIDGSVFIYHELTQHDLEYAKLLAAKLTASRISCVALIVAKNSGPSAVVLARSQDVPKPFNAATILREALAKLGARGGGSANLAQGAIADALVPELRRLLEVAIFAANKR